MGEMGRVRFRRGLDPAAQEFRPGNHHVHPMAITAPLFAPPPVRHVYYYWPAPMNQVHISSSNLNPVEDLPLSSCPTRCLLLSGVPCDVTESVVRRDLEGFGGDVRGVQMDRIRYGILSVHFYDLRHAERAFTEIRNQHSMRLGRALIGGCAVWAEFVIPTCNAALPDRNNQGTVVVSNLGLDVPLSTLKDIFQRFGGVKELRWEAGVKKQQQRLIEFYDVRDAEKAVREMKGKEIDGKVVSVDMRRPGGVGRKLLKKPPMMMAASRKHHQYHHLGLDKFHYCSGIETSARDSRRMRMVNTAGGGFRRNNFLLGKSDPCFLITESTASQCIDSRTTLMIKNIPNKYSLNLLLNTLDQHCMKCNQEIAKEEDLVPFSSYDFVYLPIDFNNKCNVGYGFVNLTSPEGACRLYKAFNLQPWEMFNSRKICQVSYARLQGLEAVKEHFRKSKFPREMKEYELPVVFSPPRDGIQLTDPLPVVGDGTGAHPSHSAA